MIDPVGLLNPKLFLLRFPIYIAADYAYISQGTVNFLRNSSIQPALRNKRGSGGADTEPAGQQPHPLVAHAPHDRAHQHLTYLGLYQPV